MKSREEFQGLDGYDAAQRFEASLRDLYPDVEDAWLLRTSNGTLVIPEITSYEDLVDPREDFIHNWDAWEDRGTFRLDGVGLERARALAERYRLRCRRFKSPKDLPYLRTVALCYWLARLQREMAGSDVFFLGVRDAGDFAGCSHDDG